MKDYFYSFVISRGRLLRNVFCMSVKPSQVSFHPSMADEPSLTPALATMAMGDCQAVAIGQTAHLGVILQILVQHAPVPRSSVFFGLVLDDLVVLERMTREAYSLNDFASCQSPSIMASVRKAYEAANLPRHPSPLMASLVS